MSALTSRAAQVFFGEVFQTGADRTSIFSEAEDRCSVSEAEDPDPTVGPYFIKRTLHLLQNALVISSSIGLMFMSFDLSVAAFGKSAGNFKAYEFSS